MNHPTVNASSSKKHMAFVVVEQEERQGEAYDLRPPYFCSSFPPGSRPRSRCLPCVLHLPVVHCWCATDAGSTRRTRSVLCLPTQMLRAILATWVIRVHTSHLAATRGTQHTPDLLIRHAVITRDVTERFPLLDTLEHGFPCRGWRGRDRSLGWSRADANGSSRGEEVAACCW